ncbi:MAG: hypothetical protein A2149_06885 [Candidatus Schekmanbacteria bacterium RBG_16_38_11]|uniref:Ancillary SecYEG translocon subunit/Cell division coordinator CpoB TPR domain-containing protein n=1 Tax=Candidatus Schekmanbacteria bacterium RBG_16_38_11 TaxID=1817880 RepID=A0A1F7RZZ9_9BACT|nr:MAG: hypothetical protein A2149_06885 [Candidatus Schekmanbacteria bacterium RBG_16_38_11]
MVRQIKKTKAKKTEKSRVAKLTLIEKIFSFVERNQQTFIYAIIAIIVIGGIAGGFWYVRSQNDKNAAGKFFNAAEIYWQNQESPKAGADKYFKALQMFQSVIQEYPGTKYADWSLIYEGNCYLSIKNYGKAVESYDKYIKEGKDVDLFAIDAYRGLGDAFIEEGKYAEAIKVYKDFIKKDGKSLNDTFLWDIGWCYERLGDLKSAKEFYKKIVDKYPNSVHKGDAEKKVKAFELVG